MSENTYIPEVCRNCDNLNPDGSCRSQGKECPRWRKWFSTEWSNIQKSAARVKARAQKVDFPRECAANSCPHLKWWESGIMEITCRCELLGVTCDADDSRPKNCPLGKYERSPQ